MKLLALLLLEIVLICHFQQTNGQDGSGDGGKYIQYMHLYALCTQYILDYY